MSQATGRDEKAGRCLFHQSDQLDLAVLAPEQRVVEAVVIELVGDLEHDVAKAGGARSIGRH